MQEHTGPVSPGQSSQRAAKDADKELSKRGDFFQAPILLVGPSCLIKLDSVVLHYLRSGGGGPNIAGVPFKLFQEYKAGVPEMLVG